MRSRRIWWNRSLLYVYMICLLAAAFPSAAYASAGPSAGTGSQGTGDPQAAASGSAGESPVTASVYEPSVTDSVYIESAGGLRKQINIVDAQGAGNYLAVLTSRFGDKTNNTSKYNVAVQVDEHFQVTKVANKAPANGGSPAWQDSPDLAIPEGGFVLLASDSDYATKGFKKYAAEHFNVGDTVKLIVNGQSVNLAEFKALTESLAEPSVLMLDQDHMFTVAKEETKTVLSGKLSNYQNDGVYKITINGKPVEIREDGTFAEEVALQPMTNYIDVDLYRGETVRKKTLVTVYRYMKVHPEREVYLWIEQSTNLNKYPTSESIRKLLVKAKAAGVTAVSFPVKGSEGFASYLKNDLSGIPHISQITETIKAGVPADLDVLQEFIRHGHELGLRIDAVFNLYGAGSAKDTGLTKEQFAEFEEWVYRPEDQGAIVPISQSSYKPLVYFMNPANDANQLYQMKVMEEVMRHYDVDGVVLDRARYDNIYADFSDISKRKFEAYLARKGKTLEKWPQDIFEHQYDDSGNFVKTVNGPLFYDWLTYRSAGEKEMFIKFRSKIDEVNRDTGKRIPFAISMGSWYTSYYEVGQNWANPNFKYDPRLGFPLGSLYTEEYAKTGFGSKDIFDYMILGTYYNTPAAVKRGITLIHVLTQEEFPVYAGFQLEQLPQPEDQRESFQAALTYTNGLKLFDLSQVNWDIQKAALENRTYVKPFQLGISIPDGLTLPNELMPHIAKGFIEGEYHNQNRALGATGVYTDDFGQTTGTSGSYGVEVIVGADGKVAEVVNKKQAMEWKWTGNKPNNSTIPKGGFVVSALDKDGVRTLRQLLANSFSAGDDIRAAMLRGHLDYDKLVTDKQRIELKGSVEVLGPGTAKLLLNGEEVSLTDGLYDIPVTLVQGKNEFKMEVRIDGRKTNEVSFEVTYTPGITPPVDPEPSEPSEPSAPPSTTPAPAPNIPTPPATGTSTDLGTVKTVTDAAGRQVSRLTVDAEKLEKAAERLKTGQSDDPTIPVRIEGSADRAEAVFPGTAILKLMSALPDAVLAVSTERAGYQLPIRLLDLKEIAAQLGAAADQLAVHITAERVTGSALEAIRGKASAGGLTILSDAYDFKVAVLAGSKKRELTTFTQYVSRTIVVPGAVDPSASTAVVYDAETGALTFVPARFAARGGQTEATIKRSGNSTYMIVSAKRTFSDLSGHWGQADIELLASKLLVQGLEEGRFGPDAKLKRAEFAALLVRALGLAENKAGASAYADVSTDDWYAGAVGAAAKAGLVQGFEDGTFKPDAAISRQEIAVMIARSLRVAGQTAPANSAGEALSAFNDRSEIAEWAQSAAAAAVREGIVNGVAEGQFAPADDVTRAQAAAMLKRMLQAVQFIN
ncbi:S-layer homology domain-containing protein [Paenibacillus sp. GCM10012303]|uniref:S-layer homology domain-containing protein n=1 Tax=Paenibacillus sp. GCM10012303 TaxID=3317340 RepID=UPI0036073EA3